MLLTAVAGLGIGLSLIVAIGAQNAFVLRQGLRRERVPLVVLICAGSDALLILLGVAGVGAVLEQAPAVVEIVRWLGVAFLLVYGVLALRRAVRGTSAPDPDVHDAASFAAVAVTCLALTWLNPHVYLDTVLLVGSVANTHGSEGRWWFAAGAATGSILWFTALGYGARWLRPLFTKKASWRVLDAGIFLVMIAIAVSLALGATALSRSDLRTN